MNQKAGRNKEVLASNFFQRGLDRNTSKQAKTFHLNNSLIDGIIKQSIYLVNESINDKNNIKHRSQKIKLGPM